MDDGFRHCNFFKEKLALQLEAPGWCLHVRIGVEASYFIMCQFHLTFS